MPPVHVAGHDLITKPGTPDVGRVRVWFQGVPEAKVAKNRIHLDIQAAPGEHEQLIGQLITLGGTILADHPRFTTLADPERNELCINRA